MSAVNKNSVRQRIINLDLNQTTAFPIDRADYVASMAYRIAKRFGRKFTCPTTEEQIEVRRIK